MVDLNNVREGGQCDVGGQCEGWNSVMEGDHVIDLSTVREGGNVMWVGHVMEGSNVMEGGPFD